jgi:cold-inducible RNA-binding protein
VSKVFVGNLDFSTTKQDLEGLFSPLGDIVDLALPVDRDSGRPRGFAFVTFGSAESAAEAIQKLDGAELLGRNLRVNEATATRSGPPGERRGLGRAPSGPSAPRKTFSRPKGSRRGLRGRKRSL